MRALIIANGRPPAVKLARRLAASADLVVCADGGANIARRMRIKPDVIVGDLDSISTTVRNAFRTVPVLFIDDQNSTDMEKAVEFCIQRGCTSVDVVGATGDRVDHTTGNLGCFKKFGEKVNLRFVDAAGEISMVKSKVRLKAKIGEKISLIPLERCTGVTTTNLKYALHNDALELGVREGISNEATGRDVMVRVRRGTLLLYRLREF